MQRVRAKKTVASDQEFHHEDNSLVARYLSGEETAFDLLYQKYKMKLIHFVYDKTHDREKSEDIVQEVFVRVWRNIRRYDPTRKFSTWIYTIAKRLCMNEIRNRNRSIVGLFQELSSEELEDREIQFEDPKQDPERSIREREAILVLRECLKRIPRRRRRIFELRRIDGKTIEETAKIMMCKVGTVKSGVSRAEGEIRKQSRVLIRRERI